MTVYVRLRVAGESYAMPIRYVLEVSDLGRVTAVPGAPAKVLGIRNLRGKILPVADLALLLGLGRSPMPARMVVAEAGWQAGFAVDEVSGIGELPDPAEETESDLLAGAVLTDGELVGVIDVARVFGSLDGTRQ